MEEGPAEIIWQGNEIIVKKKKVRVPKKGAVREGKKEVCDTNQQHRINYHLSSFMSCYLF